MDYFWLITVQIQGTVVTAYGIVVAKATTTMEDIYNVATEEIVKKDPKLVDAVVLTFFAHPNHLQGIPDPTRDKVRGSD